MPGYFSDPDKSPHRRRGIFAKLWRLITWPFRTIERVESSLVHWYHDKRRHFRHKYRHSKVIAPLIGAIISLLLWPLRAIWFVLSAPFRLIGGAASQFSTVRNQRLWMHLLQGVPAAVAGVGVLIVLLQLGMQKPDLLRDYRTKATNAYGDEYYNHAKVYQQRVLQLGGDTPEDSFQLAQTLQKTGRPERAAAILASLAPDDGTGYPPAHMMKAESLFVEMQPLLDDDDETTNPTDEDLQELNAHLVAASRQSDLKNDAHLLYLFGVVNLATGQRDKGIDYLEQAAETRKDLNFDLAAYFYREAQLAEDTAESQRLFEMARTKREIARPYLKKELEENPDDAEVRRNLAALAVQAGEFDDAESLFREGINRHPEGTFRTNLAEALVLQSYTLEDMNEQIAMICRALEIDPQCERAVETLMKIGGPGELHPQVRDVLESMIALSQSAPMAHFALGLRAWHRDATDDAVFHLEQAYKLNPELTNLANNLAWMLANREENPDLERALGLINSVLESHPDTLAYVETRGQIRTKLGRWKDALDDLERALPEYGDEPQLHEALSIVYENLGQHGLAAKHAQVAAYLRNPDNVPR